MGYQSDFNEYHNTGKDRSQMFERYATPLSCPNPVCFHDINVYDVTGDQFSVTLGYSDRMHLLEQARCKCGMPLIYRKNDNVDLAHWAVDHSRADIQVVIAPRDETPSHWYKPIMGALIKRAVDLAEAHFVHINDNYMRPLYTLAGVLNAYFKYDAGPAMAMAARLAEDVNYPEIAAAIQGELPWRPGNVEPPRQNGDAYSNVSAFVLVELEVQREQPYMIGYFNFERERWQGGGFDLIAVRRWMSLPTTTRH